MTPGNDAAVQAVALYNRGKKFQLSNDDAAAVESFRQCIVLNPRATAAFNDLGVSLSRLGRKEAAVEAFDLAIAVEPNIATLHTNRGVALAEIGRGADAVAALSKAIELSPDVAEIWNQLGLAHFKFGAYDLAVEAFRRVIAIDRSHGDARLHLIQSLERAFRSQEAEAECVEWARAQGATLQPCKGGQPVARILVLAGASLCNMPVSNLLSRDRFEIITMYLMPGEPPQHMRLPAEKRAQIDLVFSVVADADRGAPFLEAATTVCRDLERPMLNPPTEIPKTRRDRTPALLSDIPGLIVPHTRRMAHGELEKLAHDPAGWNETIIVRPIGLHNGHELERIDFPAALDAYLKKLSLPEYYVTTFWDYPSTDGYCRKYRFIFVDRQVFPYHLAISKNWMIHYWRAETGETEWMKQEEARFLADFRSVLTEAQVRVVEEIARRVDLDYAGLDCGFMSDGRVLLFETNANMLVHMDDPYEEFAYKHEHVPKIIAAWNNLLDRKLKQRVTA